MAIPGFLENPVYIRRSKIFYSWLILLQKGSEGTGIKN